MTFRFNALAGDVSAVFRGHICLLLAALLLPVSAEGQVISWNQDVNGTVGGEGAGDRSGVSEQAGVVLAGNWTNSFPSNLTQDLQDNSGNSTLLDISPSAPFTFSLQGTRPGQDADGSWNREMLNGYLNAGATSTPAVSSIGISQIPYSSYDIYVYFGSDVDTRTGTVTNGATTFDFNVLDNMITGANAVFAQTTSTGGAQPEANYAVFSGLSGSTQTISVDIPDFGGIAGFQVVNTGAVASVIDWKNDASGNFGVGANWVGDSAPGAGANVRFGKVITENRTVTLNSSVSLNSVTFDNLGDGDYFIVPNTNQTLTLTGNARITTFGRHWLRAPIAGSALNTLGNGELILDAANTFGALNINETSATVTKAGAIPAGVPITIQNNGALRFFGSENGFFFDNGTGLDPNAPLTVSSTVSMIDGASFVDVNGAADVRFTGVLSGEGGVGAQGESQVTLSAANTYNGATNVNGSTLTVTGAGRLGSTAGATSIFGEGVVVLNGVTVAAEDFNIFGEGQLRLTGATVGAAAGGALIALDENFDGEAPKIVTTGSSTIRHNINAGPNDDGAFYEIRAESGTLTLSGTLSAVDAAAPNDRNYVFSGAGAINLTGRITDAAVDGDGAVLPPASSAGANVNVIKRGSGTMTVSTNADNDYWFGNTTVEGGTLAITANGASDNELFSPVTTVKAGATLNVSSFSTYDLGEGDELAGGGTFNVGSGVLNIFDDNILTPGDGVGALSVSGHVAMQNFSVSTGSFNYELGNDKDVVGGSENDLIAISGTLTGTTSAAFNIHAVEGSLENGSYRLINHVGGTPTFTGAVRAVDAEGNTLTIRQTLAVSTSSNQVNLNVANGATGAARNLFWKGTPNNTWSVDGTANFGQGSVGGANSNFFDLDSATFGAGASTTTVNVTENVAPNQVTVNGGQSYTFSGSDINATTVNVTGGATASFSNNVGGNVVVQNTGAVAGAGTFKNDVTVQSGGTLQIGGASLLSAEGRVSWNVDNNGTIGGDGAGSLPPVSALAGVVQVGGWTNTFPDNPTTNLRDNTGNSTTLDIAPFSNSGTFSIAGHPGQDTDGTWNKELLTGYLNSGSPNGSGGAGVTITEIPYGAYDIIAYFNSDVDTRTGTVTVGGTTYSFKAAGAAGSYGGDGNATFFLADGSTTTADTANYAVFSGLSGASQTITVDIPEFGGLAGFQVVASGTAPTGETMFVQGDVSLAAGSTASFNIAASGVSDRLDISGNLSVADGFILEVLLDGSVAVSSLSAGDSWNLFDFDTSSGVFDELDFILPEGLASNLIWDTSSLLVDGTLAVISAGLPGDFNGDGVVDSIDYAIWRENLGNPNEDALMNNGDGLNGVDSGDFALWKSNYGATAPAAGQGGPIAAPEPAALMLLMGALMGLFAMWPRRLSVVE